MTAKKVFLLTVWVVLGITSAAWGETFVHPIRAGWNLMSVPVQVEAARVVLKGTPRMIDDPSILICGWEDGSYSCGIEPSEIEAGKGYFIRSPWEGDLEVTGTAYLGSLLELTLEEGWNLLGNPLDRVLEWEEDVRINGSPASAEESAGPYRYNAGTDDYELSGDLAPWTGFWVKAGGGETYRVEGAEGGYWTVQTIDLLPEVEGNAAGPMWIDVVEEMGKVFATNYASRNIVVIDIQTREVEKFISTPENPYSLVVNPDTRRIFLDTGIPHSSFVIISSESDSIQYQRFIGGSPKGIALDRNRNRIYLTDDNGYFHVIDGQTGEDIAFIQEVYQGIEAVAYDEATDFIYLSNLMTQAVTVIDAESLEIISTGAVECGGGCIDVNPDTGKFYVACAYSDLVKIIDSTTGAIYNEVEVGNFPRGVKVNRTANKIYVTNWWADSTISVIDGETNELVTTVDVGDYPVSVDVDETRNEIWVLNQASRTLSIIDGETDAVIETILIGINPIGMARDEERNKIYVMAGYKLYEFDENGGWDPNIFDVEYGLGVDVYEPGGEIWITAYDDDRVYYLDRDTKEINGYLDVGDGPGGELYGADDIRINDVTGKAYVSEPAYNKVSVIDVPTHTLIKEFSIGEDNPLAIEVHEGLNKIYIANSSRNLTELDGETDEIAEKIMYPGHYGLYVDESRNDIFHTTWQTGDVGRCDVPFLTDTCQNGRWRDNLCEKPRGIAVLEGPYKAVVACEKSDYLYVLDGQTLETEWTLPVPWGGYDVIANNDLNRIYVTNEYTGTLTVLEYHP